MQFHDWLKCSAGGCVVGTELTREPGEWIVHWGVDPWRAGESTTEECRDVHVGAGLQHSDDFLTRKSENQPLQ